MGARDDLALRSVQTKFAEWRSKKRGGESIPSALWDEVYTLEGRVGRSRVASALGLNTSQLAFEMNLRGGSTPSDDGPPPSRVATSTVAITKIVSVPLPPSPSRTSTAVEIESPSGWVMRLQSEASADFVRAFVEATSRVGGGA